MSMKKTSSIKVDQFDIDKVIYNLGTENYTVDYPIVNNRSGVINFLFDYGKTPLKVRAAKKSIEFFKEKCPFTLTFNSRHKDKPTKLELLGNNIKFSVKDVKYDIKSLSVIFHARIVTDKPKDYYHIIRNEDSGVETEIYRGKLQLVNTIGSINNLFVDNYNLYMTESSKTVKELMSIKAGTNITIFRKYKDKIEYDIECEGRSSSVYFYKNFAVFHVNREKLKYDEPWSKKFKNIVNKIINFFE